MQENPQFGDIYYADLKADGCVQGGCRPVIIASNNICNQHSPVIEVIPLSTQKKSMYLPVHPLIVANPGNGLRVDSVALAEQTRVINKGELRKRLGNLSHHDLVRVGRARNVQSPFPIK